MKRPFSPSRLQLALTFSLALGCSSGQTGSPDCGGPRECLCDTLYGGGNILRVRAHGFSDAQLSATVTEDVVGIEGSPPLPSGSVIAGSLFAEQPCATEQRSETLDGAELLVEFSHSGDLSNGHFYWAVPWSETLDFGSDHLLASAEAASVLSSPDDCRARFPYGEVPPCNDTVESCAIATPGGHDSVALGSLAGLIVLGGVLRRLARLRLGRRRTVVGPRAYCRFER